eukprot:1141598-Pelagomonas_calceolata.AAC.5
MPSSTFVQGNATVLCSRIQALHLLRLQADGELESLHVVQTQVQRAQADVERGKYKKSRAGWLVFSPLKEVSFKEEKDFKESSMPAKRLHSCLEEDMLGGR